MRAMRETEKVLALEFSTPLPTTTVVQRETARGTTRVTIEFTEDEMKVFNEIKRLSGHPKNLKDTVLRLAAKELAQLKKTRGETPVRRAMKKPACMSLPSPAEAKKEAARGTLLVKERSRTIPISIKRSVWERAGGRCEFRNAVGEKCEAKHALESDHITPITLGGLSTQDNLRVLCRQHNLLSASQILGRKLMGTFMHAIR